jgi:hypothetical protein
MVAVTLSSRRVHSRDGRMLATGGSRVKAAQGNPWTGQATESDCDGGAFREYGWTRNAWAHSTLVVDESNPKGGGSSESHDFSAEVPPRA